MAETKEDNTPEQAPAKRGCMGCLFKWMFLLLLLFTAFCGGWAVNEYEHQNGNLSVVVDNGTKKLGVLVRRAGEQLRQWIGSAADKAAETAKEHR